jgi:hypothetical protein
LKKRTYFKVREPTKTHSQADLSNKGHVWQQNVCMTPVAGLVIMDVHDQEQPKNARLHANSGVT